jgi:hypothetical protein
MTTGCKQEAQVNQQPKISEVSKVMVKVDGMIYLNKKQVLPVDLDTELVRLKQVGGAIWYCREFPEREPTEAQFAVFKKITEARLPIQLVESAKDFEEFSK